MSNNSEFVHLQANFKTPDGDLINVYGRGPDEFSTGLDTVTGLAVQIAQTSQALRAGSAVAPVAAPPAQQPAQQPQAGALDQMRQTVQQPPAQPPADPWAGQHQPAQQPQYQQPAQYQQGLEVQNQQCQHGAAVFKQGVGGRGPWAAYMCAAGQHDPTRCKPQWTKA